MHVKHMIVSAEIAELWPFVNLQKQKLFLLNLISLVVALFELKLFVIVHNVEQMNALSHVCICSMAELWPFVDYQK